jgi:hypothetical protein
MDTAGWMHVKAAAWQSEREQWRRVSFHMEMGSYSRLLEFTVFCSLEASGYNMVLWNPWPRLYKEYHDIDHITNEMWIDEEDGCRHYLVGRESVARKGKARAADLDLVRITWREVRQE